MLALWRGTLEDGIHVMSSSEHIQQFGDEILTAEVGKRTAHG